MADEIPDQGYLRDYLINQPIYARLPEHRPRTVDRDAARRAIKQLLDALDVDEGEHTAETPERVVAAYEDMLWGYDETPEDHLLTTFPGPGDPGLVIQGGIDVQSICAHHMLPFGGHATVAYRPGPAQRIVGLSKLTRLVYGYAARLQVQERIGQQVVDGIMTVLSPVGAMTMISASHDCIRLRGCRSPASITTTTSTRGDLSAEDVALIHRLHASHL
jgi:GTP cyclohydrolase IA